MAIWLTVARVAAVANIGLLAALGAVWLRNYRSHGATHTLGLLVVVAFLLVENLVWVYFYVFDPSYVDWYASTPAGTQFGLMSLCGLELVALLALARITWL